MSVVCCGFQRHTRSTLGSGVSLRDILDLPKWSPVIKFHFLALRLRLHVLPSYQYAASFSYCSGAKLILAAVLPARISLM
jgi:hypothetical protein